MKTLNSGYFFAAQWATVLGGFTLCVILATSEFTIMNYSLSGVNPA